MKAPLRLLAALLLATTAWGYTYILNDGTKLPIKWPVGTVPVRIMLGTDKTLADGSTYSSSAQTATQTWNAVLGDAQFQATIVPPVPATDHNHVNELAFADKVFGQPFGSGVLAITTAWFLGNDRTEADTIFNTAFTWDSYRGPSAGHAGAVDIQRVAIHELGHNLGLDHPDEAGQTVAAIMNSHVSSLDTLASDDITGVQNLYGPPGVPANDNFSRAITITIPTSATTTTVTGYNTNATKEPNEPNHAGDPGGHSVWWKWTALTTGSVTIDTKGSYCDTTLAIYTGSALASLTPIASNDDINPGIVQASTVTFNTTANTTYFIAVDGFEADSAGITLNLSFTAAGPVITTQPASQIVTVGDNVTFSVAATGSGTLTYQWLFGAAAISGATNATYSLTNVLTANAGSYSVTVTNAQGSATSNAATLTVNARPNPTPTPTPTPSGGGGGGGAPSVWFMAALSVLGIGRLLRNRP